MVVFVVTWNIQHDGESYSARRAAFLAHLGRYENISVTELDSVCWISAGTSCELLSIELQEKLGRNDRLFVSRMERGDYYGYLDKQIWSWIGQRL